MMVTENTDLALEPVLRFPEFEGEWERKNLGEVVKINQGLQIAISERLTEYIEGSYFYITNEFLKENSEKKYFIRNPSKSVLCTKDDILMTRTGNTGMVVTNVEGAFHNNFFKVAYPNYIDKNYLYNFLKLEKTQNQISKMAGTSTIPDLNHSDFYRIKIALPILPEQKRIASFFTVLDQKLTQLKQKKNLLAQYKKGVMQQLFSQELRFEDDDGKAFPIWKEKKLGEVGVCFIGLTYSPDDVVETDGTLILRSSNIKNARLAFNDNVYVDAKISEKNFVKENDILICARNGSKNLIGKCALIKKEHEGFAFGAFMSIFRSEHNSYLYHIFQTELFFKQVNEHLGATINQVTTKSLNSFSFLFPCLNEQTKIANFLSAIDEKINQTQTQIGKTEQYKKGLLQKMFC